MASSVVPSNVRVENKSVTVSSNGDVTLFNSKEKVIFVEAGSGYCAFVPYWYQGNTRAKVLNFSAGTPQYVTSGTITVDIYYI